MVTEVSEGIKINVETRYQEEYSNPSEGQFIFTYCITIVNQNNFTVQLLRRHWIIKDAESGLREVEGEGVIGQQPVLAPGESYTYESACNLTGEIGAMYGTYLFVRDGKDTFKVRIPEFKLIAPWKLN